MNRFRPFLNFIYMSIALVGLNMSCSVMGDSFTKLPPISTFREKQKLENIEQYKDEAQFLAKKRERETKGKYTLEPLYQVSQVGSAFSKTSWPVVGVPAVLTSINQEQLWIFNKKKDCPSIVDALNIAGNKFSCKFN